MKLIFVGGTWEGDPSYATDPQHPLQVLLHEENFETAIHPVLRSSFAWDGALAGLPVVERSGVWDRARDQLLEFCRAFDYMDLNLVGHSHGGTVAIRALAAIGTRSTLRFRTLTTIGTPRRLNEPADIAAGNVTFWQHVYDTKRDWMATLRRNTLGAIGDKHISKERRFLIPGVQNIPLKGISHSDILRSAEHVHHWRDARLLANIRGPHAGDR